MDKPNLPKPYKPNYALFPDDKYTSPLPDGFYWYCELNKYSLYFTGQNLIYESDYAHSKYRYLNGPWHTASTLNEYPLESEVEKYVFEHDLILDLPIKPWYLDTFPSSSVFSCNRHSPDFTAYDSVTFRDIFNALENGQNIYNLIPCDALFRDRVFDEISYRKNIDVSVLHKMCPLTPEHNAANTFDKNSYADKILSTRSNNSSQSSPARSVKQHSLDY